MTVELSRLPAMDLKLLRQWDSGNARTLEQLSHRISQLARDLYDAQTIERNEVIPTIRELYAAIVELGATIDEIDVDGGAPALHASTHQNGGADEITVAGLSGLLADGQTPLAHKTSHQNGGSDEISVAGLSGLLADGQTPLAHATSHQSGGSDAIKLDNLAAPDDNTDLNASASAHGLLPKLSGDADDVLAGDGTWQPGPVPLGTAWNPDIPPSGSAHSKSDEFDSGSAWDGKWTEFDQSTEMTPSVANGCGIMSLGDQGADRLVGMYQAVPGVAAWSAACSLHLSSEGGLTGSAVAGLFVAQDLVTNPTTADWFVIRITSNGAFLVSRGTHTSYTAAAAGVSSVTNPLRHVYLRIRVSGSSNGALDWSEDGIGWHELSLTTIGYTPTYVGVYMRNTGTGGTATTRVDWFRVYEGAVAVGDLLPGGRYVNVFG